MARTGWRCWAWPWELRQSGILGMNRRNAAYLLPHNPRAHYPRVDDKLQTKRICESHGIPVPQTYAVIERQGDVRRFAEMIGPREEFVVKPTQGSEGRGVLVISQRCGDQLVTVGGETISSADMQYYLSEVLAGLYSLSGRPDRVVVEQRIAPHTAFERLAVDGTPDVRVVLYRSVPAMAMVRLAHARLAGASEFVPGCRRGGHRTAQWPNRRRSLPVTDGRSASRHQRTSRRVPRPLLEGTARSRRPPGRRPGAGIRRRRFRAGPDSRARRARSQCPSRAGHSTGQPPGDPSATGRHRCLPKASRSAGGADGRPRCGIGTRGKARRCVTFVPLFPCSACGWG